MSNEEALIEEWEILDLLTDLAEKSLVVYEEEAGRYRLFESVRQYGRDKLGDSGEDAEVHGRHLGFYLGLAEQAEPELREGNQQEWLERLETEHDNLRAALDWCLAASDVNIESLTPDAALRLTGALSLFWHRRGYLAEGREHLEKALAIAGESGSPALEAKAYTGAGILAWSQGDSESARTWYEKGIAISRTLGDNLGIANALSNLGLLTASEGDADSARSLLEESLAIRREMRDNRGIAICLSNLGMVGQDQGDYEAARTLYKESLALYRRVADRYGVALALNNLGEAEEALDQHAAARSYYDESLSHFRKLGAKREMAICLLNLALITRKQNDFLSAYSSARESLVLYKELNSDHGIAECLTEYGLLAATEDRLDRAAKLLGASTSMLESVSASTPPRLEEEYKRVIESVREALGPKAFQTAWAQGCAMTVEQATTLATADL